jgi:hypothetical protein
MVIASVLSQIESALAEGDFLQAEELLRKLLAQRPGEAALLYNLGIVLSHQDRLEEAAKAYAQACDLSPAFFESWINQGVALRDLGDMQAALGCFHRALDLRPGHHDALWQLGFVLLLLGDLEQGFSCHVPIWNEWSRNWRGGQPGPVWDGADIRGGTLLVHTDGGFGDSFMMSRFLPRLAARNVNIEFIVEDAIFPLFENRWEGVRAHRLSGPLPAYDAMTTLASLPCRLGITRPGDLACEKGYLRASPQRVAAWRERLAGLPRPHVAIAWSGREYGAGKHSRRAMRLADMAPLGKLRPGTLLSVQGGAESLEARTPPEGMNLIDAVADFPETAAILCAVDAVATMDTSIAHLAGALGCPTHTTVPFSPDWRWFLDREDTPWYPSMRLYRQVRPGDWSAPVTRIAAALAAG